MYIIFIEVGIGNEYTHSRMRATYKSSIIMIIMMRSVKPHIQIKVVVKNYKDRSNYSYHVAVKSITDNFSCNAPLWILDSKSPSVDDSCTAPPRGIRPSPSISGEVDVVVVDTVLVLLLCATTTPNSFRLPPPAVATTIMMGDATTITIAVAIVTVTSFMFEGGPVAGVVLFSSRKIKVVRHFFCFWPSSHRHCCCSVAPSVLVG